MPSCLYDLCLKNECLKLWEWRFFGKIFFSVKKWVCCQFLDATSFSWSLYRNYATCRLKIYGIKNNGKGILELASNNLAFSPKFFCMLEASKFQITLHGWIDRPYMNFWSRGFLPWNYVNSLENFSSSSSLHNKKNFQKKFFQRSLKPLWSCSLLFVQDLVWSIRTRAIRSW